MKFNFYADPGHGWVEVQRELLKELGIEDKITPFSYQEGELVYLEEDGDLSTLCTALRSRGEKLEFVEHSSKNYSHIRDYQSFKPEGVAA